MEKIVPPKYVMQILVTLRSRGHLAYLVGGCVRDMLLGVRPQDWDICTSALPEELLEIFPGSLPTGARHGTVTVRVGKRSAEVTTFRSESGYADHRHPDSVCFVGDLRGDLSRRDFTMNAIALSPEGVLMDPFGGAEDIRAGLVRCVGEPARRFEEDALRMFRALRFSARLGFAIEAETLAAIGEKAPLAASLSPERVRDELEKLLLSPAPESLGTVARLGLLARYAAAPEGGWGSFAPLGRLPRKPLYRWAGLSLLLLRQGAVASAGAFPAALRLDRRTVRCCAAAAEILARPLPAGPPGWKRLLNRWGEETVLCAAACADAFGGTGRLRAVRAVLRSGECYSLRDLAVTGEDLLSLGLSGRTLGEMLYFLLDYVIDYPANNRRDLLLSLAGGVEDT